MSVYDFLSKYWGFIAIIWGLIALGNKTRRSTTLERIAEAIRNSKLKVNYSEPDSTVVYSKEDLKAVLPELKAKIVEPLEGIVSTCHNWTKNKWKAVDSNPDKPLRIFGYFLHTILFILFLWADIIAVTNALDVRGMMKVVPSIFSRLEISITVSTIFAIAIAIDTLVETVWKGEFSDWHDSRNATKWFISILSVIIIIIGITIIIALGIIRHDAAGDLSIEQSALFQKYTDGALFFLAPINAALAIILVASGAIKGFVGLIIGVIDLTTTLTFGIILYFGRIIASLGIFLVDIIIRLIYISFNICWYLFTSPFDTIINIFPQKKSEEKS